MMSQLQIKSLNGEQVAIGPDAQMAFRDSLRGPLLMSGDEGYEEARSVWNGMIDRRPALIARCTGTADVLQAVRFASDNGLLVSVHGGGHNAAGFAVIDDGLMIDLSLMKGVYVDPQARTARTEGGVTWGDLDHETQPFGLAAPGGLISTTGIAGLTLGGGFGWLRRKYGLSCDNLIAADVVTADGQLHRTSETENADLFWALRGGGGNFGVVTSFEFSLHPVGPMVMAAILFYPFEAVRQVFGGWRDFVATAPDEISTNAFIWSIPPTEDWPVEMHWQPFVGVSAMYVGSVEEGQQALQPLRELAEPLADASQPMPYTFLQQMFDPFFPAGELQYYWKSLNLDGLDENAIETIITHAETRPSPMNLIDLWAMGGAVGRVGADDSAFGDRSFPFSLVLNSCWRDPADNKANIAWTRALWHDMQRFSPGSTYLNFPGLGEEGEAIVKQSYGANYERLSAIKQKYDPDNLFRLNQNIKPAQS
jgi:FAD/FMN-containing dehydrogenase